MRQDNVKYVKVYEIPNGCGGSFDASWKRLITQNFHPVYEKGSHPQFGHVNVILIPEDEVASLRLLQTTFPATYGNPPKVVAGT